ncbi:MFS transporter [Streptomyces sp. NBC_01433]|uniref:MFS transporter n=1 Tax=Streptomyces sp. NBC_01433 TaxID=2903864 RepID=UPI002259DDDC|nr:MFS transporter [Streptomyces sp. NBC_01433]MCX4681880.1 MFS transporter [Streptomyces sp. NBC_01433]
MNRRSGGMPPGAFAALRVPNFRLFFGGQCVSLVGNWMQVVSQSWLVLQLSGSGTVLGLVVAAQFLPVLLGAPYGGLIADRADKRRLLMATQTSLGVLALVLGLLTVTGTVRLWMVVVLALALGTVNAVDNPTRQSLVPELVGTGLLRGAVSLNSVMTNAARAIGPAVAGVLIATVGAGVCFLANAASFAAVLVALGLMKPGRLQPAPAVTRAKGQLTEGLRYVRGTPGLWVPLVMMALIGTLAYEFQVLLPLLATTGLHGDARTYGFLTSAMGLGAVAGGLAITIRGRAGVGPLTVAAAGFAAALTAAALIPSLPGALTTLMLVGAAGTVFLATGNTTLQLISEPHYRGRVMALWAVTFLGSTPIGGPLIGLVGEHLGPRAGLAAGAAACAAAAVLGLLTLPRIPTHHRLLDEHPHPTDPPPPPPPPPPPNRNTPDPGRGHPTALPEPPGSG